MLFSLEIIPAKKGDCLLLHYGTVIDPKLMIIDGGPRGVYGSRLKPRLQELAASRQRPLAVDVVMVSHSDDDHIHGILDLTSEELQRDSDSQVRLLTVQSLWHNSFADVVKQPSSAIKDKFTNNFGEASLSSTSVSDVEVERLEDQLPEPLSHETLEHFHDALKVLASLPQGDALAADARGLGWETNLEFDNELILQKDGNPALELIGGLKATIVGPLPADVEAVRKVYAETVANTDPKGSTSALAAYADPSVTNLSSIVVLFEVSGKRMLLTGDARGDKILEGLEACGLMGIGGTMNVDVLKVPHHGSSNNFERDFFSRVRADHYVFSGDGEHGNPERETMEMLLDARGMDEFTIHLTYEIDDIDKTRHHEWIKQQARERKKAQTAAAGGKRVIAPREGWDPAKHSLRSLFDGHQDDRLKIKVVGTGRPHAINLMEELRG